MPYVYRKVNAEKIAPKGLSSSEGWIANIAGEGRGRPVIAWALLEDGEVIGIIQEGNLFVSAEQVLNFQGFHKIP